MAKDISARQPLLNTQQAAEYLGLSRKTLENWRHVGGGPNYRKLGGAVRYSTEDLNAYIDSAIRRNTTAGADVR
jgi:excisionase family DNA binding protein